MENVNIGVSVGFLPCVALGAAMTLGSVLVHKAIESKTMVKVKTKVSSVVANLKSKLKKN